jgi:hypothetical protein
MLARNQIPSPRHWFASSSLTVAFPVILTALLGLASVWSSPWFHGYAGLAIVFVLVAWWSAAHQDKKVADAESRRAAAEDNQAALLEEVQKLSAAVPLAVVPASARNLMMVSTADLRRMASDIAQRMRAMEHSFKRNDPAEITFRHETFQKLSSRLIAQHYERELRWQSDLQPEAAAIWFEMYGRVYGASSEHDRRYNPNYHYGYMVIERGSLAGPTPLADAAANLEDLARRLPG